MTDKELEDLRFSIVTTKRRLDNLRYYVAEGIKESDRDAKIEDLRHELIVLHETYIMELCKRGAY